MFKKVLSGIIFVLLFALIIIGFFFKDQMNSYITKVMLKQATPKTIQAANTFIDSVYNYSKNGQQHELTFLEFGAGGCVACKKMESTLAEIRQNYPEKIQVVFLNVLKSESQMLMKHYGIAAIPTQLLLDKEGKEYYRHIGYISAKELKENFNIDPS